MENALRALDDDTHVSVLINPSVTRDAFFPGQPFNTTDIDNLNELPNQQLVVAAVSDQYCIVSYWQGGITLSFETKIFELSGGNAKLIWVSYSQGGLNFQDLKEMVESGRMHNDLDSHSLTPPSISR